MDGEYLASRGIVHDIFVNGADIILELIMSLEPLAMFRAHKIKPYC